MQRISMAFLVVLSAGLAWAGCDDEPETPADSVLEVPEAPEQTATSRTFSIDTASSTLEFLMEAPLENIHGVVSESMAGDLFVDLADIEASRGLVRVDIDSLEVLQRKREDENGELGEEAKNATQNEHVRTWFQISEDAPEEVRAANRIVQFNVTSISDASETNVLEMEGADRTVTATIQGDFHLHGHTTQMSALVELVFSFEADDVRSMRVRTVSPVDVSLAEHDVRPRSAFGTLAQATLTTMGQKVAEAAPVTFQLTANAGELAEELPEYDLVTSEAATAASRLGDDPTAEDTSPED